MITAVHLDDEPRSRGEEVGDEFLDANLALEPNAELSTAELIPENAPTE